MHYSHFRHIAHPVGLLSTAFEGKENIATMAWLSPVSFDPPLLMVAVSPKRYTHDLLLKSSEFAIIILSERQKELSTLAGTKTGRKTNKWELEPFRRLKRPAKTIRVPVLEEYRALYECKLHHHFPAGDHTMFVGEVLHMDVNYQVPPLILFNRRYYTLGREIDVYP